MQIYVINGISRLQWVNHVGDLMQENYFCIVDAWEIAKSGMNALTVKPMI